jgi:hypothetical protein
MVRLDLEGLWLYLAAPSVLPSFRLSPRPMNHARKACLSAAGQDGHWTGPSYYLTVSDTGEIIDSIPPMTKLGSSA